MRCDHPATHGVSADLGIRSNLVIEQARELSERVVASLPVVIERFKGQFGQSPVLERLPIVIRRLIRRVTSQLK
jgi:hypothetical protein